MQVRNIGIALPCNVTNVNLQSFLVGQCNFETQLMQYREWSTVLRILTYEYIYIYIYNNNYQLDALIIIYS